MKLEFEDKGNVKREGIVCGTISFENGKWLFTPWNRAGDTMEFTLDEMSQIVDKIKSLPKNGPASVIVEWLTEGNIEFGGVVPRTTDDLVGVLNNIADSANLAEITGSNLFKCADGKYYTAVTEIRIEEASPEFVADMMARVDFPEKMC